MLYVGLSRFFLQKKSAWKVRGATKVRTRQTGRRSDVKWPIYGRFPYYRSLVKIAKFDTEHDFQPLSIDLDR